MNTDIARASKIGGRATLTDVRQVAVSAQLSRIDFETLRPTIEMSTEWTRLEDLLVCQVSCQLQAHDTATDEEVITASVTFAAVYELAENLDATDADFESFATVSAAFSLHPYLREALQSLTARAGLPPYVLPPLRSPVDRKDAEAAIQGATPGAQPRSRKPAVNSPAKKSASKKTAVKKSTASVPAKGATPRSKAAHRSR